MTNTKLQEQNKLIAEFMGYVQSEYPVQLHSSMSGFGSGRIQPFIRRGQYNMLVSHFTNNNYIDIDRFYEMGSLEYSYHFDGDPNHLFLSAYKNRGTKLDYIPNNDLIYSTWNQIMPVVEVIENLNECFSFEIKNGFVFVHMTNRNDTDSNFLKHWEYKKYESKLIAVKTAIVEVLEWLNCNLSR